MQLSKRMERYLRQDIDYAIFHLFEVVPQSRENAVILLIPRDTGENKYCNMKYKGDSRWFSSFDQMLDECVDRGYIGKARADMLKRRYDRLTRRKII